MAKRTNIRWNPDDAAGHNREEHLRAACLGLSSDKDESANVPCSRQAGAMKLVDFYPSARISRISRICAVAA